ncbi:arylmalonate decarboxylase [Mesorhizobium sp. J18]|uniref:arylmalonate decarboxylase n=1 Tax=Mesorhizobium sp. J18 TaxID=935263 RepID=UPI001199776C|nr:arylmalonate decarboxylase [Mesorhizobium sp. J18]TWG91797.1 arylmalonate decarboxylase [Mesorhizobium sp. J18]
MSQLPTIGMIVPPADGAVPPEPPALYGDRARFLACGLALERLSAEGYDAVIGHVADLARTLKTRGARAVSLMGTSLSFYRGPEFNAALIETMEEATGLPASTMTSAVIDALNIVGARRLAVATAYRDDVNRRLASYLEWAGFEILSLRALDIADVEAIQAVSSDDLVWLGREAFEAAPSADALFISCGGLRTMPVTPMLEAACGVPVISSAMAGAWGAMRLAGLDPRASGFGRLFELTPKHYRT